MSLYLGSKLLSGVATDTISNAHSLLDFKWTDHILNEMSWLRADTFSWHNGLLYKGAYNHLVEDVNGKSADNSDTIGSYTIWYVLADDGHKIVGPDQETIANNIYNESGVSWYYILDKTNKRFKLPRTKYGFVGLRDTVGNYVPESLPNITGRFKGDDYTLASDGAFRTDSGSMSGSGIETVGGNTIVSFDASRSSSTYQSNAPVQQRATQMYLYFYVGQYSQTATEQTAGLNSELFNGKVDLNAANLSTAGKSLISGLGMPKTTGTSLTWGASGTSYTAPSNGWFAVYASGASGTNVLAELQNTSTPVGIIGAQHCWYSGGWGAARIFCPAKKGDIVKLNYVGSFTSKFFYFIPSVGEE